MKKLTQEELDVIRLVASGRTYTEAARLLNISYNAVQKRLYKAQQKLGARTVYQLMAIVAFRRYVSPTPGPKEGDPPACGPSSDTTE